MDIQFEKPFSLQRNYKDEKGDFKSLHDFVLEHLVLAKATKALDDFLKLHLSTIETGDFDEDEPIYVYECCAFFNDNFNLLINYEIMYWLDELGIVEEFRTLALEHEKLGGCISCFEDNLEAVRNLSKDVLAEMVAKINQ